MRKQAKKGLKMYFKQATENGTLALKELMESNNNFNVTIQDNLITMKVNETRAEIRTTNIDEKHKECVNEKWQKVIDLILNDEEFSLDKGCKCICAKMAKAAGFSTFDYTCGKVSQYYNIYIETYEKLFRLYRTEPNKDRQNAVNKLKQIVGL